GHLKKEDYLVIIECLKIERNYNSCFGLLLLVFKPKINLPCQIKDQFNTYKDNTIDENLESMCSHYHAMNNLMGGQAFINPWFKVDAQADKEMASSTPEPSGNEIRSIDMESNNDYDEDVVILGAIDKKSENDLADETNNVR
ncbi:hypothetical protein VP01_5761g3, partial [Puccinia sorghi]